MFKWLFLLIIVFLASLLFAKQYLPKSVLKSTSGKVLDAALFPVESKVQGKADLSTYKHNNKITPIKYTQLQKLMATLESKGSQAVVFFYDSKSFFSRYLLDDINTLAKKYASKDTYFILVAFEDDRKKLNLLLEDFDDLSFRPLVVEEKEFIFMIEYFSKEGIKFNSLPVILFKKGRSSLYENLSVGFGIRDRLTFLIEKKQ